MLSKIVANGDLLYLGIRRMTGVLILVGSCAEWLQAEAVSAKTMTLGDL